MNNDTFQDSPVRDPIGLRFRHCREKQRMSLESVAQQLKLPVAILEAIEREDWARLGAPIFVRSYVGSYAKFLGLPSTLADDVVRGKPVRSWCRSARRRRAVPSTAA
jgi:cytoskeleton protein RodZ